MGQRTVAEIEALLVSRLAEVLQLEPSVIDVTIPVAEYGLDSLTAVALSGEIEDALGRPIPQTITWDYPTVASLARHLAEEQEP